MYLCATCAFIDEHNTFSLSVSVRAKTSNEQFTVGGKTD